MPQYTEKEKQELIGKKYNKLTILELSKYKKEHTYHLCECDCKNKKNIRTSYIINNYTKSCGCLSTEQRSNMGKSNRKTPIEFATAREVWKDTYEDCTFEKFYKLSQQNCYYCDILPSNCYYGGDYNNLDFIYNGLDQIIPSKGHFINNVVTSCRQCNFAKTNHSLEKFINNIQILISNNNRIDINKYRELKNNVIIPDLKTKRFNYYRYFIKLAFKRGYNDGNLTLEQFYQLSQLNCYYCEKSPLNSNKLYYPYKYNDINHKNYISEIYAFCGNGLDRINSNDKHNYNNVITCCKECNWAKNNYTLEEFYSWIERLKENQFWNKTIDNKINNGICKISL